MVTLTWVVDDDAAPPLRAEHGFALWIEVEGRQVLFDTGGSGDVLLHNLGVLGLDPAALDAVVLSHAHDDHTGGLPGLLPHLQPGTPLYAHPALFEARYTGGVKAPTRRSLGMTPTDLARHVTLRLGDSPTEVVPGLWTTGEIRTRAEPEGRSAGHFVLRDGAYVPDPYVDDLSLVLEVGADRVFLLCGCCHAGLLNTLATVGHIWPAVGVTGIVGGVHMVNAAPDAMSATTDRLRAMPCLSQLWLGHCSGKDFLAHTARTLAQGSEVGLWRTTAGHKLVLVGGGVRCE